MIALCFRKEKKQPILFFVFRPYSNLLFTGAICDLVPVLKTFFRVGRLWHTVDMVQRRLDIRRSPTVMVNLLFENKEWLNVQVLEVRCDILQPRGQGSDQGGVSVNCQVDLLGTNQGRVEPGGLGTRGGHLQQTQARIPLIPVIFQIGKYNWKPWKPDGWSGQLGVFGVIWMGWDFLCMIVWLGSQCSPKKSSKS